MELFITPHFCETMYAHYAEQLVRKDIPTIAKKILEQCQDYYLQMHTILVDFSTYANQLGLTTINK